MIYVVSGNTPVLMYRALKEIKSRHSKMPQLRLSDMNQIPGFGGPYLVEVLDTKKKTLKLVAQLNEDTSEEANVFVFFIEGSPKKVLDELPKVDVHKEYVVSDKSWERLKEAQRIFDAELKALKILIWIPETLRAAIIELIDGDVGQLIFEAKKLYYYISALKEPRELTGGEIKSILARVGAAPMQPVLEAVSKGSPAELYKWLSALNETHLFPMLRALEKQALQWLFILNHPKYAKGDADAIASDLGVNAFFFKKAMWSQARTVGSKKATAILTAVADTESLVRIGTLDPWTHLTSRLIHAISV